MITTTQSVSIFYFNYVLSEEGIKRFFIETGQIPSKRQTASFRADSISKAERRTAVLAGCPMKTYIFGNLTGEWDEAPALFVQCLLNLSSWVQE